MMRGASRTAFAELQDALGSNPSPEELFAIATLLDNEHGLRRTLSDPARPAEQKQQVVRVLLEGKVGAPALELTVMAAGEKWGRPRDLADAFERLAVDAVADQAGAVEDLEDDLFRFGRVVAGSPELRNALEDPAATPAAKRVLVTELLDGKATPGALTLVTQLVTEPRGRTLEHGLDEYGLWVAQRKRRLLAVVRSAVALTEEQRQRISAWLRSTYDRDVHLNVEIDPQTVGGFSIRVGDDIIDATVAGRIEDVRRRLAG